MVTAIVSKSYEADKSAEVLKSVLETDTIRYFVKYENGTKEWLDSNEIDALIQE